MITSPDNATVKQARALLERKGRQQQGRFLAEGVRLVEDALRAGTHPAVLFFAPPARENERAGRVLADAEQHGARLVAVSPAVFGTLSDTVTSQHVIGVFDIPQQPALRAAHLILVLDQLRDPGNLGTILRSAEAAAAGAVVLAPGSVDPWAPKVVRAGMGAHFRLPILAGRAWAEIAALLAGRPAWLAEAHAAAPYDRVDWTTPAGLIIGGETTGLSPEAATLATGRVAIPMAAPVDSLNAAMAATVILFEAARQRRASGDRASAPSAPDEAAAPFM
jgi:TrmH family RNA methyltransferase